MLIFHSKREARLRIDRAHVWWLGIGLIASVIPFVSSAGLPGGWEGIRMGMRSSQVIELLRTGRSPEDIICCGRAYSICIRDSRLFRHADYRFDGHGILTEISFTMREVLGKRKVLHALGRAYGVDLPKEGIFIRAGIALGMRGNTLFLKDLRRSIVGLNSRRGPTRRPMSR